MAISFEADDFDAVVARARAAGATVQTDVHVKPNPRNRELWPRDLDDYLVVIAETDYWLSRSHGERVRE